MLRRTAARSLLAALAALAVVLVPLTPSPATAAFEDTRGTIYADAVDALTARGVIKGCNDATTYCVGRDIRRDQLAALLDRALDLPDAAPASFRDVPADAPHRGAIDRAAAAGVLRGCGTDTFCPDRPTTRGQVAAVLDRAFAPGTASDRHFTDGGYHAEAIANIAAVGITDGCAAAPTRFCPGAAVTRGQAALFLGRSLDLVPRVGIQTLADRQAAEQVSRQVTDRFPDQVWDDLARCESGGNWSIDTGNGFYGGLQFSSASWRTVGGSGMPHEASREEQIRRGDQLQQLQGWGAWPHCSQQLGLR